MLDHLLAILLLGVVPIRALWRSRTNQPSSKPKTTRYLTTISMVAGLLILLTVDWLAMGRAAMALGLGTPRTTPALIGLGVAAALLAVLGLVSRRGSASARADVVQARRELLPETPSEVRLFLLFAAAVGFGWEVLYRGFLLLYLQPHIGLTGAVVTAALAYGLAHGFKGWGQFAGSIVAAFAFTIGYAMTGNLWWLILLHTALPLLGLFTGRLRVSR